MQLRCICRQLLLILLLAPTVSSGQSYVRTETSFVTDGSWKAISTQYYDGIGRESSQVTNGIGLSGKYVYSLKEYDVKGRLSSLWQPAVGSTESEALSSSALSSLSVSTYGDNSPYTAFQYDALNRLTSTRIPGEAWLSADKKSRKRYDSNKPNSVKRYTAPIDNASLVISGYYSKNVLSLDESIDEDGKTLQIFKDENDRIILERIPSNEDTLDTYYVYNDLGLLRYVLMPEYQKYDHKDKFAYEYIYDEHGRVVKKKLPKCGMVQYWYDNDGKLIGESTPQLRAHNKTRFWLYDSYGRVAIQGICDNLNYNSKFDVQKTVGEGFLGTGYDYPWFHALTHPILEIVNYYDDYSFLMAPVMSGKASQLTYTNTVNVTSLQTGCIRRTSSEKYVYTAFYYDEKGQMIRKQDLLHDGTLRTIGTTYSFTGKPLVETNILSRNCQVNTIIKRKTYYAENDQLDTITISYNGETPHIVAKNEYNDLGQLSILHREGYAGDVNYTYDLHGWPATISGKGFSEWLHYADGLGQPSYTGNISSFLWKCDSESFKRGFILQYNDFGWITKAEYGEGEDMNTHVDRYTEWVKEYTKSGAIRKLERYGKKSDGKYGKIDNLRMYYTGCQIDSVKEDAAPVNTVGAFDFISKTVAVNDRQYDYYKDGSLKWDANKGIALIQYDYNTYPCRIQFVDGSLIEYVFTVDGEKLQTIYRTAVPNMSVALGSTVNLDSSNTLSVDSINYIGSFILENGLLSKYLFNGGYMTFSNSQSACHYYTKDHLGNNRAVVNSNGDIEQVTHYYPFGAVFADAGYGDALQRYKYNGKELDRMHGLNFYDYGARQYDPLLCRFTMPDAHSEDYFAVSPYAYCLNNPVKNIDPDGRAVETLWDAANVALDATSLVTNVASGNLLSAAVDAGALLVDVAATAVPFVPGGAGAAIKAYRAGKAAHATETAYKATKNNYRKALQKATGKTGKGYEAHHTLPQKHRRQFEDLGINIDEPGNVVWRETKNHQKKSNSLTREWDSFMFKHNGAPTKKQIYKQRDYLENKYFGNKNDIPAF